MKKRQKRFERRVSHRVAISFPVSYDIKIPPFKKRLKITGVVKDINAKGLSFVASHKPAPLVLNLHLELPTKEKSLKTTKTKSIDLKVKVAYAQEISNDHQDIMRTGACFVNLSKNDAVLLEKFLDQYTKKKMR